MKCLEDVSLKAVAACYYTNNSSATFRPYNNGIRLKAKDKKTKNKKNAECLVCKCSYRVLLIGEKIDFTPPSPSFSPASVLIIFFIITVFTLTVRSGFPNVKTHTRFEFLQSNGPEQSDDFARRHFGQLSPPFAGSRPTNRLIDHVRPDL